MTRRIQIQAVFFAVIMVISMVAMGAGGVAAQSPTSDEVAIEDDLNTLDTADERIETTESAIANLESELELDQDDYETAPALEDASGETVLLLSVERGFDRGSIITADTETLQADSEATLQPVADDVNQLEGAVVREQFWLGNIISVTADLDTHDVEDFASIDGVQAVAPNTEAVHPAPPEADPAISVDQDGDVTYGLDQIDVPGFEEEFDVSGEDATVSIIDDGVSDPEEGHPDLEFETEAIAANGSVTTGTLGSPGAHGEHVAGTATAAAEPEGDVPRYGVAPDAGLIKINAFEEGAFTEDLIASVQFSAEQDADVASMSLGFAPVNGNSIVQTVMEDAIQDANAAGTLVIGSAGNEGAGDLGGPTTSPGAEFSGFSVGASNEAATIAGFSSGDLINQQRLAVVDADGNFTTYPDTYPREYVKPDVAAPGVDVLSAGPLGEEGALYSESDGTSMAAPHVAGSVALVQSATDDELHPKLIESALVETAEKPDNEFIERHNRDIRFGAGIINVTAATQAVEDGTIEASGNVTDSEDDPIVGATVGTDDGALATTDEDGEYTLQTTTESPAVTADAFGSTAETQTVDTDSEVNFQLDDEVAVDLIADQPQFVEFGDEFDVTVDVRNLENLTVELSEETDVAEDNLTLRLGEDELAFGEPTELGGFDGVVTLVVEIDADADVEEGDLIGLEHTFEGPGDTIEVATGPTELTADLQPPTFEITEQNVPQIDTGTLIIDEEIDIEVEITNTGQQTGTTEEISLVSSVSYQATNDVTLEPGESETIVTEFPPLEGFFEVGDEAVVESLVGDELLNLFEEGEDPLVEDSAVSVAIFVNEESAIDVDVEFIGTVDDDPVTVTGDSLRFSDGGPYTGDAQITVDGEPWDVVTVEDGFFEAELDPTELDVEPQEDVEIDIEAADGSPPVNANQTAEVDIVHEVVDLDEGFNLQSVPQGAELAFEDVDDTFVWDSSTQTYDDITSHTFNTTDDLNEGLYLAAGSDDARLGYAFLGDAPTPGVAELDPGWNFVGSNFDISPRQSQPLSDDLRNINESEHLVFNSGFTTELESDDPIAEFDSYWVFVDNATEERPIITPAYDRAERSLTLGTGGGLDFNEQATASDTFTDDEPTDAGVVVENVRSVTDSAIVVTYEDNGDLIVAGVATADAADLNRDDVVVPVEDTGGFPGEHTAHVIPLDDLSDTYTAGDTVSADTAAAALDQQSATILQGEVTLENQTVAAPAEDGDLTVDAELAGDADAQYVVDLHETDQEGDPGAFVGTTDVVSGAVTGEEFRLEDPAGEDITINETDEFVAMIHIVDDPAVDDGDEFPPATFPVLPNTDATEGFVPGGVTDQGEIEID